MSASAPRTQASAPRASSATPPPLPRSARDTAPTLRIGPYRVEREIGAGGMSVVYRSVQESLRRTVAIKVLRAEIAKQPHLVERFDREASSLAALHHENILQIYDYRTDGQLPYMVTEYLEGVDLYDILERHGRISAEVTAIVGLQVARALDYAHSRGVIHRDVKPANIMFTIAGGIKLMDFGIARQTALRDLTQAGAGVGTPAYMSPEQILGDRLDGRTDIWSLGIVLYQMLTGGKPFQQDDHQSVLQKIRAHRPDPPRHQAPDVPRELERIVLRCLEKHSRDRYPMAQQLALALERFLATRLDVSHKVHLLRWLESLGEITPSQAQSAMPSEGSGVALPGARRLRRSPGRWLGLPPVGWVAAVSAVGFLSLLAVVLLFWPRLDATERRRPAVSGPVSGGTSRGTPKGVSRVAHWGGLRVVAHPWAYVAVDGERCCTTPLAKSIDLAPGPHEVVFEHPRYGRRLRRVRVKQGQVTTVIVDFLVRTPGAMGRAAMGRAATARPMGREGGGSR